MNEDKNKAKKMMLVVGGGIGKFWNFTVVKSQQEVNNWCEYFFL